MSPMMVHPARARIVALPVGALPVAANPDVEVRIQSALDRRSWWQTDCQRIRPAHGQWVRESRCLRPCHEGCRLALQGWYFVLLTSALLNHTAGPCGRGAICSW